jgi:MYXO-CTERM domain-containing protein
MFGRLALGCVAALIPLAFSSSAGATGISSGDEIPGAAGAVFSSGQTINVVVPDNSAFAAPHNNVAVNIVECSAPNGVIPTDPTTCDGNTIQGGTFNPNSDGSFTYTGYPVYALPDSVTLLEGSGGPSCGNTSATECILYIGNNQADFTQSHLWSQPFFVTANGTDSGTASPGYGTPEVPTAILLPLAAAGLLGGVVLHRRRRRKSGMDASASTPG